MRHQKYLVHDPDSSLSIGEHIRAIACRPLSARKRFVLHERLGFKHAPDASMDEAAEAARHAKADAAMSAEQREWLRIDQLVNAETKPK